MEREVRSRGCFWQNSALGMCYVSSMPVGEVGVSVATSMADAHHYNRLTADFECYAWIIPGGGADYHGGI